MLVETIEVGIMTAVVPPATFVLQGTGFFIILIFSDKLHSIVIRKWITGIACNKFKTSLIIHEDERKNMFNECLHMW